METINLYYLFDKKRTNSPSHYGLTKPINISKELASFTGFDINNTYFRFEIIRFVLNYIKNNKLFDENDKRYIIVDNELIKLLKDETNRITFYKLQEHLRYHFF